MITLEGIVAVFRQRFGGAPAFVVRAPGRVNLIGEHTDYNEGFVMPVAIDRSIWIALRPRGDDRVLVASADFDEAAEFALGRLGRADGWAEYVKGTAWALLESGHRLRGWEGVVAGDVPIGAGLSSSAALELAAARAFAAVSGLPWDAAAMARVAQRAENEWVGVRCGIMDQMAAACGRQGHAVLIDCRSLETSLVPVPPTAAVLVLDTATRRGLVDSHYNERRSECDAAARRLGARSLRDVEFSAVARNGGDVLLRRARHVVTENARTQGAADALRRHDVEEVGRLMDQSHQSLKEDFEVVTPALDTMVAGARRAPGCFGARMTGAGFGGCAVALVRGDAVSEFIRSVEASYEAETGVVPHIHVCRAAGGAELVSAWTTE